MSITVCCSTKLLLLCALLSGLGFQGCLRYVPSRAELQDSADAPEDAAKVGGPEQFLAYEAQLQKNLQSFINERTNTLQASATGSVTPSVVSEAYRIGPGDTLKVDVFGLPEMSSSSEVTGEGAIIMPYVDAVTVGGLTLPEAKDALSRAYRTYVRNPKLNVQIEKYGSSTVSVIGSVARPGVYPLKNHKQNITDILSLAGGRTDRASTRIIILPNAATPAPAAVIPPGLEMTGGSPRAAYSERAAMEEFASNGVELDMSQIIGGINSRPLQVPLMAGDTIIVPEAGTYKVAGEVNKPGSFTLSAKTSALGAIAAAGGLTYSANVKEVEVVRDIGNGQKASYILDVENVAVNGSPDVILRDSDIVRIPSEPGLFRTRQAVEFLNGFFRAGINATTR